MMEYKIMKFLNLQTNKNADFFIFQQLCNTTIVYKPSGTLSNEEKPYTQSATRFMRRP